MKFLRSMGTGYLNYLNILYNFLEQNTNDKNVSPLTRTTSPYFLAHSLAKTCRLLCLAPDRNASMLFQPVGPLMGLPYKVLLSRAVTVELRLYSHKTTARSANVRLVITSMVIQGQGHGDSRSRSRTQSVCTSSCPGEI